MRSYHTAYHGEEVMNRGVRFKLRASDRSLVNGSIIYIGADIGLACASGYPECRQIATEKKSRNTRNRVPEVTRQTERNV